MDQNRGKKWEGVGSREQVVAREDDSSRDTYSSVTDGAKEGRRRV